MAVQLTSDGLNITETVNNFSQSSAIPSIFTLTKPPALGLCTFSVTRSRGSFSLYLPSGGKYMTSKGNIMSGGSYLWTAYEESVSGNVFRVL